MDAYITGSIFQPLSGLLSDKLFNNVGAIKVVIAAPVFPIPKIPKALPCHSFGYQIEVYPIPTAKLVPTNPKKKLRITKLQNESAKGIKKSGTEHNRSKTEKIILPPYLSVKIPIGSLKIEPERIGIPKSHPISTTVKLNIPLSAKKVIKTPFKVQQAKHTVKASVLRNKIRCD